MNNDFLKKLEEIRARLPEAVKRLPAIVKIEGLGFIHDNFDREGFEVRPGVVRAWVKRKAPKVWQSVKSGTKSSKLKATKQGAKYLKDLQSKRNLLVKSGAMRRSFDNETTVTDSQAFFTSSLPYTEAHNNGLMSGRPPGFKMPERKMIGDSEALTLRIEKKFDKVAESVFK